MSWIVYVPYSDAEHERVEEIETDVKDERNAIPQAKQRNSDPKYDWNRAYAQRRA